MALNAPFFVFVFYLRTLVSHSVLGFFVGLSEGVVFELANQSRVSLWRRSGS